MSKRIFIHLLCLIFFHCFIFDSIGQIVSNVDFRQEDDKVIINYDLEAEKPADILVYCSVDGGRLYSEPLKDISGDIRLVSAGPNKEIIWDVLGSRDFLYGSNIVFKVQIINRYFDMVFVGGGTFLMGNNVGNTNESPVHEVTLDDFYICRYEVSQEEWKGITGKNPAYQSLGNRKKNYPAESISYEKIKEFIEILNDKSGENYRLPTEAEWEFAARGGNESKNYIYSGSDDYKVVAWHSKNSNTFTQDIGKKLPNELGIFDMSGNVWEFCQDYYSAEYYSKSPKLNPQGPESGSEIVIRGGSVDSKFKSCTVTNRANVKLTGRSKYLGFRLVSDK